MQQSWAEGLRVGFLRGSELMMAGQEPKLCDGKKPLREQECG